MDGKGLRQWLPLGLQLLLACCLACNVQAAEQKSTVRIVNETGYGFYLLYLSSTFSDDWGPDLLEDSVLLPGQRFTLTEVPCAEYDLLIVDEDGNECILSAIPVCDSHETWSFDADSWSACLALSAR